MKEETDTLTEDILEMRNRGEVIICMDANAKVGLMGESISRNGQMMMEVFKECKLEIMNGKDICKGVVTRQNRRISSEKLAIDFIVASYEASLCFHSMIIDESGDHRIRYNNKNDSDHNTVIASLAMGTKRVAVWRSSI